ncbi:hypothetical protein F5Y10DRAFT_249220 [Nemania abortiva]|nr:hypothetical protein F5Y10DRAFT_249220 [Nemania abortiva]
MQSHRFDSPLDRSDLYTSSYPTDGANLWDRFLQPSILIPVCILLLTVFYQSLRSSVPFPCVRHPGELLWDLIVTATPARLLYALDRWLHPPIFPVPESTLPARPTTYAAKSDLLRRILSMDSPKSIMNAVAHAGKSISSLSNIRPKGPTDQPPGLGNYDNSCFQNSILQSLASLKPLPAYLTSALEEDAEAVSSNLDSSSVATLRDLLSKLGDSHNNGMTLWTPKKLKSLDTWQQQDAQEYYSKILDEIDKEVTKVAMAQYRPSGLETASARDDTVESQHSDDSGYQSLSSLGKSRAETRTTRNPLEGLVAQRVVCVQCGHSQGLSMIPFNCLTLNLGVGQGIHDLYERLDSYTALESIEGVECAKCTLLKIQRLWNIVLARNRELGSSENLREPLARLKVIEEALEDDDFEEQTLREKCRIPKQHRVSSTKTKQMVIGRPPSSLAIHINRSVFDENTGQMFKNLAAVRFPSTLDLGPWCLGSAGSYTRNDNEVDLSIQETQDGEEQWSSDPESSMVSGDLRPSKISGPIYELRAVITHQGRHENGHYVCYRKHPRQVVGTGDILSKEDESPIDNEGKHDHGGDSDLEPNNASEDSKWWRLSDETVWEVTEEMVLAQGGVFMLFYDCVDHNSVLVTEGQHGDCTGYNDNESVRVSGPHELDTGLDGGDEFHDAQSELKALDRSESLNQLADNLPNSKKITGHNASEQLGDYATSSLFPLLKLGEGVDPMIPIHWPNS